MWRSRHTLSLGRVFAHKIHDRVVFTRKMCIMTLRHSTVSVECVITEIDGLCTCVTADYAVQHCSPNHNVLSRDRHNKSHLGSGTYRQADPAAKDSRTDTRECTSVSDQQLPDTASGLLLPFRLSLHL